MSRDIKSKLKDFLQQTQKKKDTGLSLVAEANQFIINQLDTKLENINNKIERIDSSILKFENILQNSLNRNALQNAEWNKENRKPLELASNTLSNQDIENLNAYDANINSVSKEIKDLKTKKQNLMLELSNEKENLYKNVPSAYVNLLNN